MSQADLSVSKRETSVSTTAISATKHFLDLVFPQPRNFQIRLWDGSELSPASSSSSPFCLVLKHSGALRKMFTPPIEKSLGEAFMCSDFDIEGDILSAMSLVDVIAGRIFSPGEIYSLARGFLALPKFTPPPVTNRGPARLSGTTHTRMRDESAIQYHYDVSNDFYALWLGKRMQYSCAYFKTGSEDIDTAQVQKLEHICRKLHLKAGERLLDIGCGWGGLAIYAAQTYNVRVVGISLSKNQVKYASEQVEKSGLSDHVSIRLQDYRDIDDGPFDKIVSIGMFEHVGHANLPEYFAQAFRLLKPGGLFLNHGIGVNPPVEFVTGHGPVARHPVRPTVCQKFLERKILAIGTFTQHYFFPDGELVAINEANLIATRAGFELRDLENLREHYALTLRQWVRLMEEHTTEAENATNKATLRTWRLYMASSAYSFSSGKINVNQSLFSKPDAGSSNLPLTRADLYKD
jgi:cyclopropane-fatty-acyl-phospholipid synthase